MLEHSLTTSSYIESELRGRGFAMIETHISRVFVGPHDVYKTKRPVNLGFVDYSTLETRERACLAEVKLNARLAPDVYHGVVAIVRDADGRLRFVPHDEAVTGGVLDWAVHMVRLADDDRSDIRLGRDQVCADEIEETCAHTPGCSHGTAADARTDRRAGACDLARSRPA